jgi:hypothetical protein
VTVPLGSIIHLANYMILTKVKAETTMPDTPDMYGADLEVLDDHGGMDLSNLAGLKGPDGQVVHALRRQEDSYTDPDDLPVLTNTQADNGKYWVITERDEEGNIISQWAYIWYGNRYRKTFMGAEGPPGSVPKVRPSVKLLDPQQDSFIDTTGGSVTPSWRFNLAAPAGASGPISTLDSFTDFEGISNTSTATDGTLIPFPVPSRVGTGGMEPRDGLVVMFTGKYDDLDQPIFTPMDVMALNPTAYSVPQSAFEDYNGLSQRAAVGSFSIPPQPFDWTPVVWGHIGMGGATLSLNPLMIGVEILLGNPTTGIRVGRGLGNPFGEVNIMPHYSTPEDQNKSINPENRHAVVPANHSNPADGTVYINLYNDGQLSYYSFSPRNAQLLVLVVPIDAYDTYAAQTTRRVRR